MSTVDVSHTTCSFTFNVQGTEQRKAARSILPCHPHAPSPFDDAQWGSHQWS
jgi:hypothetical protein